MAVLILLVGIAVGCTSGGAVNAFVVKGKAAELPPEQLSVADAQTFQNVLLGLRGKPVLVNIWASWCVPCRAEGPMLRRAADETAGEVVFLGIDAKDDLGAARSFLQEFSITYPNLFDAEGQIPAFVGLRGYPTTIAIDRTGSIKGSSFGGLTDNRLAALLAEIR